MKACYRQEHKLPVDVRGSKTSGLKLSNNYCFRRGYGIKYLMLDSKPVVLVETLAEVIMLRSWLKHFTLYSCVKWCWLIQ